MNKDYLHYTAEDFIADEAFQDLVRNPTKETNDAWKKWIIENPDKAGAVHEATIFINHLSIAANFPSAQKIDAALTKTLAQIDALEEKGTIRKVKHRRRTMHLGLSAFTILMVSLIYLFIFKTTQRVTIQDISTTNDIRTIHLPDSSEIILNKNSSLKYSSNLANSTTREVWLDGEAYFDVHHKMTKASATKFVVHVNDMKIEVLGTTFNVKRRDNIYNVSLNTGKINITLKDDANTQLTLAPGDFLQYSSVDKNIVRKKVRSELYSGWKREKMILDNTPLIEIADLIRDVYGYNIIIQSRKLEQEKISGTITVADEQTMLQALSFALDLNIRKEHNNLIFEPKQKNN